MSMPWPVDLGSGTVLWDLGFMKADNDDSDRSPQLTAGTGITVNFSPDVSQAVRYNGVDGNKTIMPLLSQGIINEEGLLCTMSEDGTPDVVGVVLPATDSETMTPRDWTYTVTVLDNRIIINRFSISLATGAEIDLADFAPVDSSGGTHIVTEVETAEEAKKARDEALEFRNESQEAFERFTWPVEVSTSEPKSTDVIWVNPDEPAGTSSDWAARAEAAALRAENALRIDTSVGIRAFFDDVMIFGDTGWRDISAEVEGLVEGSVKIKRDSTSVWLHLESVGFEDQGTSYTSIPRMIPQGFRYGGEGFIRFAVSPPTSNYSSGPIRADQYGHIQISDSQGKRVSALVQWESGALDTWPSTLPGISL